MAKRKSKSRKRSGRSPSALLQAGMKAFKHGKYTQAITTWEQVGLHAPRMRPVSALAEAYFRRGLNLMYGQPRNPEAGRSDLEQASGLRPDEARYTYHFGLAAHHLGELERAIPAYRAARKGDGGIAERAAYPLALALLQSGQAPSRDPVWSALTTEEQAALSQSEAFRRRPYTLPSNAPPLWRGLAALDAGDRQRAQDTLQCVAESPVHPVDRAMAHYYQGVLAARDEDWDEAGRQWSAAHAAGLATPNLVKNLGELYHRLAEKRLVDGDTEGALAAAEEALRHRPGDKRLNQVLSQAHQRLAHKAATAGHWSVALDHWEMADVAEGGSFRLAYNLALAYERSEEFFDAGEKWREALRRRPRRDDHPDAINDEQIAQLWRRAAEAYTKAGEFDEAVRVFRQAVKWNPDHIETRLALAEALLTNGQLVAAENELNRILERDPDNIPALLRQGEVVAASGRWWYGPGPTTYWERVLELEPDNGPARQLLADYYHDQADIETSWGYFARAVEMYQLALEYQPQSGPILAALGGCYLRMGEEPSARKYFAEAMRTAPTDLNMYAEIIHAWLDVGVPHRAWEVVQEAETTIDDIPYVFYISQAYHCIRHSSDLARPWLERAVEKAPPGEPVFMIIGEMAVSVQAWEIAREYLEQAIATGQATGQGYLMLGIVAAQSGDLKMAEQHWRQAEKIARRQRDAGLLERARMARIMFSGPTQLASLLMRLRSEGMGGPPFTDPDFFYDEDDEDDDDLYWGRDWDEE